MQLHSYIEVLFFIKLLFFLRNQFSCFNETVTQSNVIFNSFFVLFCCYCFARKYKGTKENTTYVLEGDHQRNWQGMDQILIINLFWWHFYSNNQKMNLFYLEVFRLIPTDMREYLTSKKQTQWDWTERTSFLLNKSGHKNGGCSLENRYYG